ncbi:hypothetical protein [uncultured Winogradskyella sp.]|uniref:hypothetical protein n=1 Tax=uncultured Winogradskyella sp. TaxID=395353 RepID=UPI0030DCE1C2|tara:strand:- start:132989 stop:133345 length:357 start_codon:yes stop_codon:yes gene_type:complete
MNKPLINFVLTLFLAVISSLFTPWWSVMIVAFATALFVPLKRTSVFFIPFLAIFLFWAIYSFILSSSNDYTLAKRISVLLTLGGNPYVLIVLTGFIGGLAAGVSAILGKQIHLILKKT